MADEDAGRSWNDGTDLIVRAMKLADARFPESDRRPYADLTDDEAVAAAVVLLADRLAERLVQAKAPPTQHKCGWCWRATGGTPEAWQGLAAFTSIEDARTHAGECEHNPLVQEIRRLKQQCADLQTGLINAFPPRP